LDEKLENGKLSNINEIQNPSPPYRDTSKLQKARILLAFGGFAFALGLAFLIEIFLDRSVRRSGDIETRLGLPLFLTIPLIGHNGSSALLHRWGKLPLLGQHNGHTTTPLVEVGGPGRNSQLLLLPFFDALRDRLIGFFEIKNLTHKPKLVAVTSCAEGAGASTIASGLAASLSETGDGNVLLVDMNHSVCGVSEGSPDCVLDDALQIEKRGGALVKDNLYVVCESGRANGGESGHANGSRNGAISENGLARILPKRFTSLMPRLKASDYDYIIFDMPPISQLSITPRVAKCMDMVILVIESEKTDRDILQRATTYLAESKPNLCAILNKRRTYVPKALQQEI
jgi:polysaccharide biosynthesis transport protein